MADYPICGKLTRKAQVLPPQGSGYIARHPTTDLPVAKIQTWDDGKRLANPDGPEAAAVIESLVEALECIQRDIRSNDFDGAAHADAIDTLLRPVRT